MITDEVFESIMRDFQKMHDNGGFSSLYDDEIQPEQPYQPPDDSPEMFEAWLIHEISIALSRPDGDFLHVVAWYETLDGKDRLPWWVRTLFGKISRAGGRG